MLWYTAVNFPRPRAAMFRSTNCLQINEALVARFCGVAGALQLGPGWDGDGETRTAMNTLRHVERWGHLELETPTSRQNHTYRGPTCLWQLLCNLTAITDHCLHAANGDKLSYLLLT